MDFALDWIQDFLRISFTAYIQDEAVRIVLLHRHVNAPLWRFAPVRVIGYACDSYNLSHLFLAGQLNALPKSSARPIIVLHLRIDDGYGSRCHLIRIRKLASALDNHPCRLEIAAIHSV